VVEALRNSVDGHGLASAAKSGGSVVIVTDDYTRPTPAGQICEAIMDELNSLGVEDSCISILAGGGLHRPMTRDELMMKFGGALIERARVISHNAWDDAQLEYVGTTSMGTPVWVNRLVAKADLRVTVGMITAHFMAGYASGPKTILPGASGYRTIVHNHGVVGASQHARIGVIHGNPCWEDMAETVGFLRPTLAVDVVLNTSNELVAAFHGDPVSAQKAGLDRYHSIYSFDLKEKADIVIASANPMYSYLDQCLKAIIHASMLVKDGGTRIVASPCEELLGPPFLRELYYESLRAGWPSANEYAQIMQSGAIKDVADAVGILKLLQTNNSTLTLVCDRSFEEDLTKLGFSHMPTVQAALDEATVRFGQNSKVLVMPYGAITHPIRSESLQEA
jgi:nickel-dependent lactate racemase